VADAVGTFSVITGVDVPVATIELRSVPVVPRVKAATEVTVPTDTEPPKDIAEPLMVILEFTKLVLPILDRVLVDPDMDLLVNTSVVALPTKVSVADGNVSVDVPATALATNVVTPEVEPLKLAPVAPIVGNISVLLVRV
jgi:hypothetical protein